MSGILKGEKFESEYYYGSMGDLCFANFDRFSDKIFQIDANFDVKETYGSAKKRTIRTAIALQKLGVKPNDIIVTCSNNNLHNAIPNIATWLVGAQTANLDPSLSVQECQHLLGLVDPAVVFVQDCAVELIEAALKPLKRAVKLVVIGEHCKYETLQQFAKECLQEEEDFRPVHVDCKETALIFFSSGTTGLPKGICCSHFAMINASRATLFSKSIKSDVMFHFTSFYWITASMILVFAILEGGCRVVCAGAGPEDALKIIQNYGVTFSFMAPLYVYDICAVPSFSQYNLRSLFSLILGGTGLAEEPLQVTRNKFKDTQVMLLYGMTETSGCITNYNFRDGSTDLQVYGKKLQSSGRCAMDTMIKVVDLDTRTVLGPNEKGEILVKSPFLANGYHKQDASQNFDSDGFLKTGDIGYYDQDEYIYIVDRIKEMFKYKSWHIVPTALENVLNTHEFVQEAVVFGVPHEKDGDLPAACVLLKEGKNIKAEDLDKMILEKLGDRNRLRGGIKFVPFLYKTPTGKTQRRKMKEYFMQNN